MTQERVESSYPVISVVVPVYNGELTIIETIKSVLNQTYQHIELIVIDDGSQDGTLEILTKIQDPRMSVYSYTNAGLSASRNRGIGLAEGEYISFLDADDLWTVDKLESQLLALLEHPEAAIAYSWTEFVDDGGKSLGYGIHTTQNGYVFPDLLTFFFIGSGSNALFRRNVFEHAGGFDKTLQAAEDWDMFLRLAADFQFVCVPKAQILYRVVENSMSGNVLRQERECLKVVERAFSREPGRSLVNLKKIAYANLYLYLADRALKEKPNRKNGFFAVRFLWLSLLYNPLVVQPARRILLLSFKTVTAITLPPDTAVAFREKCKSLGRNFYLLGLKKRKN